MSNGQVVRDLRILVGIKEWVGEGEGEAVASVGGCGDDNPTTIIIATNDSRNSTTSLLRPLAAF